MRLSLLLGLVACGSSIPIVLVKDMAADPRPFNLEEVLHCLSKPKFLNGHRPATHLEGDDSLLNLLV